MAQRSRIAKPLSSENFVVSVEHASNRIPGPYRDLGLHRRQLESHIAWDPGARIIAAACSKALSCPLHEGRFSRLLIDLNRSLHHPRLMARRSFSIDIPGNQAISKAEREKRVRLYYTPFRDAVLADVRNVVDRFRFCVQLSVHSFTPEVDGVKRNADIGILYDPKPSPERTLSARLIEFLSREGFHVRRNYPYRGTSDGHTTHLRRMFPEYSYAGIEIEVNQALVRSGKETRAIAERISAAVQSLASL